MISECNKIILLIRYMGSMCETDSEYDFVTEKRER